MQIIRSNARFWLLSGERRVGSVGERPPSSFDKRAEGVITVLKLLARRFDAVGSPVPCRRLERPRGRRRRVRATPGRWHRFGDRVGGRTPAGEQTDMRRELVSSEFGSSPGAWRSKGQTVGLFAFLYRIACPSLLLGIGKGVLASSRSQILSTAKMMRTPAVRLWSRLNDFVGHRNVCHGRLHQL